MTNLLTPQRLWLAVTLCTVAAAVCFWVVSGPHYESGAAIPLQRQRLNDPSDHRGWAIKARLAMQAERYDEAASAYKAALSGPRSKVARDPDVWVEYAEALALSRGGKLAGEPLELAARALSLLPDHPGALDLAAAAAWDAGDYSLAAAYWQRMLPQWPASDPRRAAVLAAIGRAKREALFALPSSGPAAGSASDRLSAPRTAAP